MFSNSYLEIGLTHKICQDYALCGSVGGMSYAIISDGCSEAPRSEIGAQILCSVAEYYIKLFHHTGVMAECSLQTLKSLFANSILKKADEIRRLYPISHGSLQATLLIAISFEQAPHTLVFTWGDGYIIEKQKTQTTIHEIKFAAEGPVYMVTDPVVYTQQFDDVKCFLTKNHVNTELKGLYSTSEQIEPFKGFAMIIPNEQLVSVTLCSDGLKSYQDKDLKPIDMVEMAQEVTDYRSYSETFVERCMNFSKLTSKKTQRTHYDDFSTAAILI